MNDAELKAPTAKVLMIPFISPCTELSGREIFTMGWTREGKSSNSNIHFAFPHHHGQHTVGKNSMPYADENTAELTSGMTTVLASTTR